MSSTETSLFDNRFFGCLCRHYTTMGLESLRWSESEQSDVVRMRSRAVVTVGLASTGSTQRTKSSTTSSDLSLISSTAITLMQSSPTSMLMAFSRTWSQTPLDLVYTQIQEWFSFHGILCLKKPNLISVLSEMIVFSGFRVTNAGCCGIGRNAGQITCLPGQRPCRDRNAYVFWDAFHPTEAANVIIARRSYNVQSSSDAYPIDISRLARLWRNR